MTWITQLPAQRLEVFRDTLSKLEPILEQRGFDDEQMWVKQYAAKCAELKKRAEETHKAAMRSDLSVYSQVQRQMQVVCSMISTLVERSKTLLEVAAQIGREEMDTVLLTFGVPLFDIERELNTGFVEAHEEARVLKRELKPYRSGRPLRQEDKEVYGIIENGLKENRKATKKLSELAIVQHLCNTHDKLKGNDPKNLLKAYKERKRRQTLKKKLTT
jgi:hypothetical protein